MLFTAGRGGNRRVPAKIEASIAMDKALRQMSVRGGGKIALQQAAHVMIVVWRSRFHPQMERRRREITRFRALNSGGREKRIEGAGRGLLLRTNERILSEGQLPQ